MKTYLLDIIPKLKKYSKQLDDKTLLMDQPWVVIDESAGSKTVYRFRDNGQFLLSTDGKVKKGHWEYLDSNTLLLDIESDSYIFKHGFLSEQVLALKIEGKEEFAVMFNENKIGKELNSIDDFLFLLKKNYLGKHQSGSSSSSTIIKKYGIKSGQLEIFASNKLSHTIGDKVLVNGQEAPNGEYHVGYDIIEVKDGRINFYW